MAKANLIVSPVASRRRHFTANPVEHSPVGEKRPIAGGVTPTYRGFQIREFLRAPVVKGVLTDTGFENTVMAQQIFGGRGLMTENPVERLVRDVRYERIWEGTSEIQKVIVSGQIKKRGLDPYAG